MVDALGDDDPMTLDEACRIVFRGAIKPATLIAEARRGRLVIERIGRRNFVTRTALKEMRARCRVLSDAHITGSAPSSVSDMPEAERAKVAHAAALASARALRGRKPS